MPTLMNYSQRARLLIGDIEQAILNEADLQLYINEGRRQAAIDSGCIRSLATFSTVAQQEIYPFTSITVPLAGTSGILATRTVSLIFGNIRYTLKRCSFSGYQALVRRYTTEFSSQPVVYAQMGEGTEGAFYLYPIASDVYVIEVDCICNPADLIGTAGEVDVVPEPFASAVIYYAVQRCFEAMANKLGSASLDAGKFFDMRANTMMNRYREKLLSARAGTSIGQPYSWYGR